MSKENIKKIKLIKKYARIRFNRFWKEWGLSKEDVKIFGSIFGLFATMYLSYLLVCVFL